MFHIEPLKCGYSYPRMMLDEYVCDSHGNKTKGGFILFGDRTTTNLDKVEECRNLRLKRTYRIIVIIY